MLNCSHGLISVQCVYIHHNQLLNLANKLNLRKVSFQDKWNIKTDDLRLCVIGRFYECHCAEVGDFFSL